MQIDRGSRDQSCLDRATEHIIVKWMLVFYFLCILSMVIRHFSDNVKLIKDSVSFHSLPIIVN